MNRRTGRMLAAAAIPVAGAAVAAFLLLGRTSDGANARGSLGSSPIEASGTLAPRALFFGDTVRARIDVRLDGSHVDPASVRVAGEFPPFDVVARSTDAHESGDAVLLRTTLILRCVASNCVPAGASETYELPPARVSFSVPGAGGATSGTVDVDLPPVRVFSRFAALVGQPGRGTPPWQADVLTLPPVTYRADRDLLVVLLLLIAAAAALAGVALVHLAWPRRVAAPAPEPPPPPLPVLSPLEQALELLERSIGPDGAPGRRRALELVAEELERAEWGDHDLARASRALAWSEDVPAVAATSRVAARVREALSAVEGEPGSAGAA